jgi:hypothetical protein
MNDRDKTQPTGAPTPVASNGAAARAGNETDPPPYAAMPAAAPEDLPKSLSAEDRDALNSGMCRGGKRALALIDALTARLDEAVARMTVAEQKVDELKEDRTRRIARMQESIDAHLATATERDAALARAEAAELERDDAKREYGIAVASYKQACAELDGSEGDVARLESEAAALRAENERLRDDRDYAHSATVPHRRRAARARGDGRGAGTRTALARGPYHPDDIPVQGRTRAPGGQVRHEAFMVRRRPEPEDSSPSVLTPEERTYIEDSLLAGQSPRSRLIRKLLRLYDESRLEES